MRALFALACGLSLGAGCYASHQRTSSPDAGGTPEDAALVLDTGPPGDPCVTVCEAPRVLARIPLALCCDREPAVLDSLVHRDELVVALLIGTTEPMPGPSPVFFLARISRRTGEARIEPIEARGQIIGHGYHPPCRRFGLPPRPYITSLRSCGMSAYMWAPNSP